MAGLDLPLSTLHPFPRGNRRMTRGRTGSLDLVRTALSSATYLRLSPALSLTPLNFLFASGSKRLRKVGIVALARKLLIVLWRYAEHGEIPQEAVDGAPPCEGAS